MLRDVASVHRVGRCISHPPWADFPWSISPQLEQCRRRKGVRWKYLAETFPKTYRSVLALAPSWLSIQSSSENHPRGV